MMCTISSWYDMILQISEENCQNLFIINCQFYFIIHNMFVDTNAITTYMFGMDYQGCVLPELETMALRAQSRYDIYFLCCDDIPYDDTWDRSGDQKRHIFQKQIVADLKERKIPYVELKGSLEERIAIVERVLSNLKKYDNPAKLKV
jgi:HTH-type transcriptional regulator, transcriptional repressor of NAD biosynthesis genes